MTCSDVNRQIILFSFRSFEMENTVAKPRLILHFQGHFVPKSSTIQGSDRLLSEINSVPTIVGM